MKCTAYSRAERSSPADGVSSCKQSLIFACRQQLIKYRLFTTKTSCFFNAFLTHLRDLFLNRAWSLSSALDAFSCKQSLIFACRLNYPAKLHAATACRFCVRPAHRCKNFAGGFVGGVRGFLLPAISVSSLAVSSSLNIVCSRRKRRVFLMCAKFFAHICTISSKLRVEPVVWLGD